MNEITLPEQPVPPALEDQIRAAIYQASNYHWPTKIICGYRTVYLIDQWTYDQMVAAQAPAGEAKP